ncbi:MAG: hypothetical protein WBI07_21575 [Mobilitalea sp.]
MKNRNGIGIIKFIICILVIGSIVLYLQYPKYDYDKKYVKEYTAVANGINGNVDISTLSTNPAYQIGVNINGYIVFKNPKKAFSQMKVDFTKGISAIRKDYYLLPLTKWNYKKYKTYGWQLTKTKDSVVIEQAGKLSAYLDIFENSLQ